MSDNLNDKKYDAIDVNAILDIKISGQYYTDLRVAFAYFLTRDNRSAKDAGEILDNITKGKITSEEEHALAIVFHMLKVLQHYAVEQGHVVKQSVNEATGESPENPHSENNPSE